MSDFVRVTDTGPHSHAILVPSQSFFNFWFSKFVGFKNFFKTPHTQQQFLLITPMLSLKEERALDSDNKYIPL